MTELQSKLLDILKIIDEICRENDIDFFLTGGSLIGALRHKGFIPWDDDADIIMSRDNFMKFREACKKNLKPPYKLCTQMDNPEFAVPINHFSDMSTTEIYRFQVAHRQELGLMIDVLIMDPVPDTPEAREAYEKTVMEHFEFTNHYYHYAMRFGRKTDFKEYYERSKEIGREAVIKEIDSNGFCFREEESQLYSQRLAGAPHFWPKEMYGKPKYVPFEDTYMPIPARAGDCLSIGYDDEWYNIPRMGDGLSTHEYCIRNYNVPSKIILDDFDKLVDEREKEETFLNRKLLYAACSFDKQQNELELDEFAIHRIRHKYKKVLYETDIKKMLASGDFDGIRELFREFEEIQFGGRLLGGSSLAGWKPWYMKNHPKLVDIGDDGLCVLLASYLHEKRIAKVGKLLKARDAVERPWPQELEQVREAYRDIKQLRSSFECEEYDICNNIIEKYKGKTLCGAPDAADITPIFGIYDAKIAMCDDSTFENAGRKAEALLDKYEHDEELLLIKALVLLKKGRKKEAFELFSMIADNTDNGLVLLSLKENLMEICDEDPSDEEAEKLLHRVRIVSGEPINEEEDQEEEDLEEEEIDEQNERNDVELNEVQKKRLTLLAELDRICKTEDIRYYLIGDALRQALMLGELVNPAGDISVYMYPEGCLRFIEAVEKENNPNREIVSMKDNPSTRRFYIKYCDTQSMDFNVVSPEEKCGLFITIEILRHRERLTIDYLFNRFIEKGWETQGYYRRGKLKTAASRKLMSNIISAVGKDRIGDLIFRRLTHQKKIDKKSDKVFVKRYMKKRQYFPAEWFGEDVCRINLSGVEVDTTAYYDETMSYARGEEWLEKTYRARKINFMRRIIDAELPYEEYFKSLEESGIDRQSIWKKWQEANSEYVKNVPYTKRIKKYWRIMEACGIRYALAEEYLPIKEELQALRQLGTEEADEELFERLLPLRRAGFRHRKLPVSVCFDDDIQELYYYFLEKEGWERALRIEKEKREKTPLSMITLQDLESYKREGDL